MRRYIRFATLAEPHRGNVFIGAGPPLARGLPAGAIWRPSQHAPAPIAPAFADTPVAEPAPLDTPIARRLDPTIVYPMDVLRISDGETFEARVRVWPGLDVDAKIRLRGIDAAELHARCPDELAQAQAARTKLEAILAEGGVTIS